MKIKGVKFVKWNSKEGKKAFLKMAKNGIAEMPTRFTFIQSNLEKKK